MDMKAGGVRRIIVPESIGYPGGEYMKWAPSPTTFSVRFAAPRPSLCVPKITPRLLTREALDMLVNSCGHLGHLACNPGSSRSSSVQG